MECKFLKIMASAKFLIGSNGQICSRGMPTGGPARGFIVVHNLQYLCLHSYFLYLKNAH